MNEPSIDDSERDRLVKCLRDARNLITNPAEADSREEKRDERGVNGHASVGGPDDRSALDTRNNWRHFWSPVAVEGLCALFGEERTTTWLRIIRQNIGVAEAVVTLFRTPTTPEATRKATVDAESQD